jgi:hypothetical protein
MSAFHQLMAQELMHTTRRDRDDWRGHTLMDDHRTMAAMAESEGT